MERSLEKLTLFLLVFGLVGVLSTLTLIASVKDNQNTLTPLWRTDLRSSIGGSPVGLIAGGKGHEYEYRPRTSLLFTNDGTLVVTFVVRGPDDSPRLSHRGESEESLPLRLKAIFLDPESGTVRDIVEWPVESRDSGIVAAYNGNFATATGGSLVLYSSDRRELKRIGLPIQYHDSVSSPTGKTILYLSKIDSGVTWTWIRTETLEIARHWTESPRGTLAVSDSEISMSACVIWNATCGPPQIDVKTLDTNWRKLMPIADRRKAPVIGFIREGLLYSLEGESVQLVQTDGTVITREDGLMETCWGVGAFPSARGNRFVIPFCKLRGRSQSLDLSGHDELKGIAVYDSPFQNQAQRLRYEGPKIDMPMSIALSPDGSKLALLNGESICLLRLPAPN